MRKLMIIALGALLASGCAHKWPELKKVEAGPSFVLAKDYVRTEIRGPFRYKWVEGLRAGTYRLEAEDEEGSYFRGQGGCVVMVANDKADEYLKTGRVELGFLEGGLWLPKKGVEKGPKIFYMFMSNTSGPAVQDPSAPVVVAQPQNMAQGVGAGIGAGIAAGAAESAKGDILFIPYESEQSFVDGLKLAEK